MESRQDSRSPRRQEGGEWSQLEILFGTQFCQTLFQTCQLKGAWTSHFISELEVHLRNVCRCVFVSMCAHVYVR